MDPKKQELNPELKEIYDRVMNTQIKNAEVPNPQPSTPPPVAPPASTPQQPQANPVMDTKSFVFTGNKVTTPEEPHVSQPQTHPTSSKKISTPIIAVLVVVLIVVWVLFWAKFFGLI